MDDKLYCIYKNEGNGLLGPFIVLRYSNGLSVLEHRFGADVNLHTKEISEDEYIEMVSKDLK